MKVFLIKSIFLFLFLFFLAMPISSAAHFIVGYVQNASDGTSPNGKDVVLWNPSNGINDNLTDIVGNSGNSGASNIYLIDCELLLTPCAVGDEMRAMLLDSGDGYLSSYSNVTVTGAGFDVMPDIVPNSPPFITQITVDDSFSAPVGEIDLVPASTQNVICEGVAYDYDGNQTINNLTAEFFRSSSSFYGDSDDNNYHYSNSSCQLNLSYGSANETYFSCGFETQYYAESGAWNCTVFVEDDFNISSTGTNSSNVNTLLALSVPSPIDFGTVDSVGLSDEFEINVTNVGNAEINLTLSGYGQTFGDGLAMNCSLGSDISIESAKYNLTTSNSGPLTLDSTGDIYYNLTANPIIRAFNLAFLQDDGGDNPYNTTFWRMYVPAGAAGTCSGNIIFGAVQASE